MELKDDKKCFVCGPENEGGLRLIFAVDEAAKAIKTEFIPAKVHQGYQDVVHGGVLSAVLDEAMTKLAFMLGMNAVTGRLVVRFKRPLMVGEKVYVTGRILSDSGRAIQAEAEAVKGDGTVVAEAEGLLMRVK